MKFVFFHLMPYPYLPDDFDEKYVSMSLDYPNRYFDPEKGHELYHRYLDQLEWAEELGFDGIAVNEHHQTSYGIMPSPNIMAATLARRTTRAQIMVLGNAIPIRDNPIRVAEEVAMLDHLTSGRLACGFVRGIGWEYFAQSINPTRSAERFFEAHDLILKAFTATEPFEWVTRNYEYRYVNIWPRPLQQPYPPIYMAGSGTPDTMRWAAKHHHVYMSVIAPTQSIKGWFNGYRKAAREEFGWEAGPDRFGWVTPTYVGETDKKAVEEARGPIEWYFHKSLRQPPGAGNPPGYIPLDSMKAALERGTRRIPTDKMSIEDLIAGGYILVGSAETVAERITELGRDLGFGTLGVNLAVGSIGQNQAKENMEAFAKEVMPKVRKEMGTSADNAQQPNPVEPAP